MEIEKEVKILNLDDILPNRFQPRIQFNESAISELADSIKEHGVIQPIVVRKLGDKFEIIAGERRYKASLLAGKSTIPAIITTLDDKDSAEIALIENVQRQDLTPIEEAISYKKILDMGYLNQTELADKLGKTQSTIANKLRLLNLAEEVQEALLEQKISERHARSLLKLPESKQPQFLERIISERLTVRRTDEEIKKILEEEPSDEQKTIEMEKEISDVKIENNNITSDKNDVEELEILDFDLEGKGELEMREEYNIPMEKIIEPMDETPSFNTWSIPTEPVAPVVQNETPSIMNEIPQGNIIAPGFVDVNKIENEAEDIFKPQSNPADMDMLLQATSLPEQKVESPMAPATPEMNPETKPQPESTSRFFGMFNSIPEIEPTQDLEKKETNMDFGEPKINNTFMFDFEPLKQTEIEQPKAEDVNDTQTIINEPAVPFMQPAPTPIVENSAATNFTSLSDMTPSYEDIQPQNNVELSMPMMPNFVEQQISSPAVEVPNIPESNIFMPNVEKEEPAFEPFNPYSLNENDEFTQKEEVNIPPMASAVETPFFTEQNITPVVESKDIKEAIAIIRECAKKLEEYGFKVEVDELDFPESYQVNFRIDK